MRTNILFFLCGVAVVLFFIASGSYLFSLTTKDTVPGFLEWVFLPGTLLAGFGIVGVHSDHFLSVALIANICFYLSLVAVAWRITLRRQRREGSRTSGSR